MSSPEPASQDEAAQTEGASRLRDQIAVIFQDFVHYPFSVADNVALEAHPDTALLERSASSAGSIS